MRWNFWNERRKSTRLITNRRARHSHARSLGRDQDTKAAAQKTVELAERELISNPEDPRPAIAGALALLELGERTARKIGRRALMRSKIRIRFVSTTRLASTAISVTRKLPFLCSNK